MALLLFGEPASQLSALQLAQVSYALATLSGIGGSGSSNPLTRLQKTLGLDRLSVGQGTTTTATGATENTGAAMQAGRYVTKRVYVEGKQSTTGQSQVEVDVDLTKHLKLQTRLGNGTAVQGTTPAERPGQQRGAVLPVRILIARADVRSPPSRLALLLLDRVENGVRIGRFRHLFHLLSRRFRGAPRMFLISRMALSTSSRTFVTFCSVNRLICKSRCERCSAICAMRF